MHIKKRMNSSEYYNVKQTPKISILVASKYKTNKDFIKIVVYFDDTISSFSTKISYQQCC